jgi:hypothetical protein
LKKFELNENYHGNETTTGKHLNVEEGIKGNGLFMVFIEVGLMKVIIGNVRVCGDVAVIKCLDLDIPHYSASFSIKYKSLNVEIHRKYILHGYRRMSPSKMGW